MHKEDLLFACIDTGSGRLAHHTQIGLRLGSSSVCEGASKVRGMKNWAGYGVLRDRRGMNT